MREARRVRQVPEGEFLLLSAARALVSPAQRGALELLTAPRRSCSVPDRISGASMGLLRQTLARGCARELLLRGGWRRDLSLDGAGEVRRGRLWERHRPLPPLCFGATSLLLCRWLAEGATGEPELLTKGPLEIGDELLILFALELAGDSEPTRLLAEAVRVRGSALAWLVATWPLARAGPCPVEASDFERLTRGAGALVLEALGPELTRRWVDLERSKATLEDPAALSALGAAQEHLLEGLLAALEEAGRRDLASFLVDAAEALLRNQQSVGALAELYLGHLDRRSSLASRQQAQHSAGAFLRALGRIRTWNEEHRYVRAIDDEYAAAQALLARWEGLGVAGFERCAEVLRELDRLDATLGS